MLFRMKSILNLLPMPDNIVVLKVTGAAFKEALENGVSGWPHFDGKWPLLSGVKF